VIEVKSDSDRLKPLRNKMREYLEQGAQLGWLIDPGTKTVEIYRPGGEVIRKSDIANVEGEGPVAGFALDLTYVWDPLAD
jgi:Uma2 family endonuclease